MEPYNNAAIRHYQDSNMLNGSGRWDNAGHLIGFAAECAIKHVIVTIKGKSNSKDHFPVLATAARKHLTTRDSMHNLLKQPLLKGWTINRRYCATGDTTKEEILEWAQDTRRLLAAAGIKVHQ